MKPEPLVLLPGMMCDARLFTPQIEAFSCKRTVSIMPMQSHSDMASLAKNILLQAPPRFALAGLSMGGIVAMEVCRQAPERISRLALLDTNPLAEAADKAAAREPQITAVHNGRLREVMRDEMKPNYLADGPYRQRILDICMDMAEALGPTVFVRQSRALQSRPDQTQTLQRLTVPTMILCGEHDALCPPQRHQMMHNLVAGSTLTIIKDAGHMPTLEQPAVTTAALDQWLRN
ncbi:MAG: alpha/beta hydrolase [Pseudomonadota bacterium]